MTRCTVSCHPFILSSFIGLDDRFLTQVLDHHERSTFRSAENIPPRNGQETSTEQDELFVRT